MCTEQLERDLAEGLSRPARQALAVAGITTLEELSKWSEADVGKLHGMGPKGIRLLRESLAARGLSFANKLTGVRSR